MRIFILLLSLAWCSLHAQSIDSLNFGPEPRGGISKLALIYYKIDFSKAQRVLLDDVELELIFDVDTLGGATLEKVNGISDKAIIDSLKSRDNKLSFIPYRVAGKKQTSLYFMKFAFPQYYISQYNDYRRPDINNEESLTFTGRRWDVVIGGMVNGFSGMAADYIGVGGGMKIDMMFIGKKELGIGFVMDIYANKRKEPYPLVTIREQSKAPSTLLIGAAISKLVFKKQKKELMVQLELCYALQTVVPSTKTQSDYLQLSGFSPGIIGHYNLQVGGDKISVYRYGQPVVLKHQIDFHAGVRPVFFELKQASGVMLEAGISYRMGMFFVE